jgi:hypothetical protein
MDQVATVLGVCAVWFAATMLLFRWLERRR